MEKIADTTLWDIVFSAGAALLGGIGIYHAKKIHEFPEKYTTKEDFITFKKEVREDMKENTRLLIDRMEGGFDRIYEYVKKSNP